MRESVTTGTSPDVSPRLAGGEITRVGVASGLLGGVALAAPLVIWDWMRNGHLAFEMPMAATSWIFGLDHFSHRSYHAWPLVIGIVLLFGYAALSGVIFTALADRVYAVRGSLASLAAGLAWAFVSFVFFWDMLLPITRNGVPLRPERIDPRLFAAPNWPWILGFVLLGIVTGASYAALRATGVRQEVRASRRTAPTLRENAA